MSLFDTLILQHAQSSADRTAIATADGTYSYAELLATVDRYCALLLTSGVQRGDRLLVVLEPSMEAVALLCACSRGGIIFVPISPEAPLARFEAIAATTAPKAVVTAPHLRPVYAEAASRHAMATLTVAGRECESRGAGIANVTAGPSTVIDIDPLYIVFTSGSTGTPKGIVMTHRAVCAFATALVDYNALPDGAVVGSMAPIQFDFWILDVALALGSGQTIAFISRGLFYQPRRLVRELIRQRVTQVNGVPSLWLTLLEHAKPAISELRGLQAIFYAGEAFPIERLRELTSLLPGLRVINCFGQSESVACAFRDVPTPIPLDLKNLSFGRGHAGVELLNISRHGKGTCPPWEVGELYLRAPSLFSGYWNDPEATARALVVNPLEPRTGERVFKTGDLVYTDEEGNFYFAGRADDQVKVLGNRVELNEVAGVMRAVAGVHDVVVVAPPSRDSECSRSIIAYVVPDKRVALTPEALRQACAQVLPTYMLPSRIEFKTTLPLNANGKVDVEKIKREWIGAREA